MTGWPLVGLVVAAAGTGITTALVIDKFRQASRKLDRDIRRLNRQEKK